MENFTLKNSFLKKKQKHYNSLQIKGFPTIYHLKIDLQLNTLIKKTKKPEKSIDFGEFYKTSLVYINISIIWSNAISTSRIFFKTPLYPLLKKNRL